MLEIGTQSVYRQRAARLHGVEPGERAAAVLAAVLQRALHACSPIVVVPALFALRLRLSSRSGAASAASTSRSSPRPWRCRAWLMFNRNEMNLGGTNGLTDFKTIFGFPLNDAGTQRGLYVATALCLWRPSRCAAAITRSRAGRCWSPSATARRACSSPATRRPLQALRVRASPPRWPASRARSTRRRSGSSRPAKIGVLPSIEMVIWVAVGGRGTLVGAVVGALGVNWLQSCSPRSYPDLWLLVPGRPLRRRGALLPGRAWWAPLRSCSRAWDRAAALAARLSARPRRRKVRGRQDADRGLPHGGALSGA